eukprot:m.21721 g.21721  ORF g.21721 m.21721 type:complete len:130 (-) comp5722_c0_seq1:101-490(-)
MASRHRDSQCLLFSRVPDCRHEIMTKTGTDCPAAVGLVQSMQLGFKDRKFCQAKMSWLTATIRASSRLADSSYPLVIPIIAQTKARIAVGVFNESPVSKFNFVGRLSEFGRNHHTIRYQSGKKYPSSHI